MLTFTVFEGEKTSEKRKNLKTCYNMEMIRDKPRTTFFIPTSIAYFLFFFSNSKLFTHIREKLLFHQKLYRYQIFFIVLVESLLSRDLSVWVFLELTFFHEWTRNISANGEMSNSMEKQIDANKSSFFKAPGLIKCHITFLFYQVKALA